MGFNGAVRSARQDRRPSSDPYARSPERAALSCLCRMRLAFAAQMFPSGRDGAALLLRVAQCGLFNGIDTLLVMNLRGIEGREASPSE